MRTLKEMVVNNQKVRFVHYQDKELWYATECGFEFPIPISDCGSGIFLPEDKAIAFMRWIRKHLDLIEKSKSYVDGWEVPVRTSSMIVE
ncbi:hypothetical protein M0R72_00455 [Candidatus Pacearchaeota archaeon]|jgi:hypothetical protein|nr:hypothetical protein [Candidatus Pacearchaeota archaeon]